jgi:hypothetical protein
MRAVGSNRAKRESPLRGTNDVRFFPDPQSDGGDEAGFVIGETVGHARSVEGIAGIAGFVE